MNFFNDEIHQDMVDMYRDFAQNSCGPIAAELDESQQSSTSRRDSPRSLFL